MNRLSKIFFPQLIVPKNAIVKSHEVQQSKSQKLMIDCGLIKHCNNGTYYILPLLQRSIEKLTKIIDHYMTEIDGQKITMPTLTSADLWKKSGRFENAVTELMTVNDRHNRLQILSPTHEESVTNLIASISPVSYKSFPLRLYQITPKFRDELRPKFGLLRAKEFLMKDMYTFDIGLNEAKKTYDEVNEQYVKIFNHLNVSFIKIGADTGNMGGNISHEFHIASSIGEDSIISCTSCSKAINVELAKDGKICEQCKIDDLKRQQGIEIGHTFILEDRYSKVLNATFLNKTGKPENIQMGCYGIGVTRLIAAVIELFSNENEIRWSDAIAPYKICIIPPKEGSKEEESVKHLSNEIYHYLTTNSSQLADDIIVDDRTHMTIGKRLKEIKKLGIPYIIVIGSKSADISSTIEVHNLRENVAIDMSVDSDYEIIKLDPNVIYETDDDEDLLKEEEYVEKQRSAKNCENAAEFVFIDEINKTKNEEEDNKQMVDDIIDKKSSAESNDLPNEVIIEQKPRKKLNLAEYKIVRANRPAPIVEECEKVVLELCENIPETLPIIELPTDPRSIKALLSAQNQQPQPQSISQPEPMQIDKALNMKEEEKVPKEVDPDYEEIVLISMECNTDISISPQENDEQLETKAPAKFLTNIVNTIKKDEYAKTLLSSSTTLFSSINAVVHEKCNSLNEATIENSSSRKNSEHGENKIIMHLRKDRIRPKCSSFAMQTENSPLFPPLLLSPDIIFNRIKNVRNFRRKSRTRSRSRSRSRSFSPENDYYKRSNYKYSRSLHSSTVNSSEFDSSESDSSAYSSCRSSDYDSIRKFDNRISGQRYRNHRSSNYTYEEERKVVYIGGLTEDVTKEDLRRNFLKYGTIKKISIHAKQDVNGNLRFGFITFAEASAAYDVLDKFKLDSSLCDYDIRFGGRRRFCKQSYADLDSLPKEDDIDDVYNNNNININNTMKSKKAAELSFEELLNIARQKMCRNN
ncbi:hypothetical protein PVAND_003377 [Polypedilum vanderplanki]|uniref:Probable proline--tRNA ligase, mitochondrial n=1 Tax=Polypedilum vanderplanki TaxID=319348 RepID=A0A9J6BUV4_POLVA|nr:hypothetical protein PVAND_003377 [Polypedilum vanderplanki]